MDRSVAALMPEEASSLLPVYPYSSFNYCFCIVLMIYKVIDFLKRRSPELVKCDKLQATKVVVLDFSVI